MEENRQALATYFYLVKYFGFENNPVAFLDWYKKFKELL